MRVYPGIALVHHRPDLYPQPEEFRPERFLDEGAESYSWLPFGGGIRRCIGAALAQAEMAEVLRVVLEPRRAHGARRPERGAGSRVKGITLAPTEHAAPEMRVVDSSAEQATSTRRPDGAPTPRGTGSHTGRSR